MNRDWRAYSTDVMIDTRLRVSRAATSSRWKAESYIAAIFLGDRDWGNIRLMLMVAAVVMFVLFGWVTETHVPRPWVERITAASIEPLRPVVFYAAEFVDTLPTRQTWRHALFPILGFIVAIWIGGRFVGDLFELDDERMGRDYLRSSLFGNNYARLGIRESTISPADFDNPLVKIGGPGYVYVGVALAAVCEKIGGPADVLGTGLHFLRRFETVREVFDLRDQFRTAPELKAMTKDGIVVTVRDVNMSFRLRTGNNRPRTESDPYPFSIGALRRAAYNRTVGPAGPTPWVDTVAGAISGQIRSMIARRRLDDVIGPNAPDARAEMLAEFNTPANRRKFNEMGAEVLWVSLGHFESPQSVSAQRIRTWQADWQRLAKVTEAEGQAERIKMEEEVRGEAVQQLIEALDRGAQFGPDSGMTPADQFFVLLAETLESYARQSSVTGKADPETMQLARELRHISSSGSNTNLGLGSIDNLILH